MEDRAPSLRRNTSNKYICRLLCEWIIGGSPFDSKCKWYDGVLWGTAGKSVQGTSADWEYKTETEWIRMEKGNVLRNRTRGNQRAPEGTRENQKQVLFVNCNVTTGNGRCTQYEQLWLISQADWKRDSVRQMDVNCKVDARIKMKRNLSMHRLLQFLHGLIESM